MTPSAPPTAAQERITAYFRQGDALRSRCVSDTVLAGLLEVPSPSTRLLADWERDTMAMPGREPGDVEPLSLPRARMRWPDYRLCVQAVEDWMASKGLAGMIATSEVGLMTCRGARYHHDGALYASSAFCNLFLGEDKGLDVHFPHSGQRMALQRGTVLVFDTGQPHAVVRRGSSAFDAADFGDGIDCTEVFLTWELPIDRPDVANALQIVFDVDPDAAAALADEQVLVNGAPATVCPATGAWQLPR